MIIQGSHLIFLHVLIILKGFMHALGFISRLIAIEMIKQQIPANFKDTSFMQIRPDVFVIDT